MGPTQGPYILQLCVGPSYFWGVWPLLTPPYFAHCVRTTVIDSHVTSSSQCQWYLLFSLQRVNFEPCGIEPPELIAKKLFVSVDYVCETNFFTWNITFCTFYLYFSSDLQTDQTSQQFWCIMSEKMWNYAQLNNVWNSMSLSISWVFFFNTFVKSLSPVEVK